MHTPTLVLATVALLSSAVAAQDRPKFYFPRQVKRQISNNSVTTNSQSSSSTKRDLIGDLLGALTGGVSTDLPSSTSQEKEVIKTVVVSNTVIIGNGVTTTLGHGPQKETPTTTPT